MLNKTCLILLFLLVIYFAPIAGQIDFKSGYYVDHEGNKISCLIKDKGWNSSPESIVIKLNENSDPQKINKNQIVEFFVNDQLYRHYLIDIDRSNRKPENLTYDPSPVYVQDSVLLKYIIKGPISLLEYRYGNLAMYYYQKEDQEVHHLIYKKYKKPNGRITENTQYKYQLLTNVQCSTVKSTELKNVKYKVRSLIKYFEKYYECSGEKHEILASTESRKTKIKVSAGLGLRYSDLKTSNRIFFGPDTYGGALGYSFHLEEEFIPPFNYGKWTFLLGQGLQHYKKSLESNSSAATHTSLEALVGARHYFFINKSRLFLNVFYAVDIPINSGLEFQGPEVDIEFSGSHGWGAGAGFNHEKISLELRYHHNRNLSGNYIFWRNTIKGVSAIIKYQFN